MEKLNVAVIAAAALLAGLALPAAEQDRKEEKAEVQLQAAMHKEKVDGNLPAAIEEYKKIAQGANRALAAQALIRMAECYQRLGESESKKIYERVLRDYSDQKEAAAIARTKLGHTTEAGIVTRQVWTGDEIDLTGGPSPNGRYLAYANWKNKGNLAIRDLKTGESRDLTKDTDWSFAESAVFMPDGNRILYTWYSDSAGKTDVRMISLDGSNIRTISDQEFYVSAVSRDGKLAAGFTYVKDSGRQVAVLDLTTRKLAVLKSVGWLRPVIGNFSPDGRYLAYSLPARADSEDTSIYVIAVDGSEESTVVAAPGANRRPLFMPDGARIVFASNRSSRWDLLAVPIFMGKAAGAPETVKADVGQMQSVGLTADGSLYFGAKTRQSEAYTMALDPGTWRVKGEPKRVSERFVNINASPVWSPDGRHLAYVSNRANRDFGGAGGVSFVVRDTTTSAEREFPVAFRAAATARAFRWFPDNHSLLLTEYGLGASARFRKLDLSDGSVTTLFQHTLSTSFWAAISPDGHSVYYGLKDPDSLDPKNPAKMPFTWLARRDLQTGEETHVAKVRAWGLFSLTTSLDGRYAASFAPCKGEVRCLWVMPLSGGEARLLPPPKGRFIEGYGLAFTPHSDGVFATITEEAGTAEHFEIWYLPLNGTAPHSVGIPFRGASLPAMHPSGAILGFTDSSTTGHVSVMHNLFPQSSAAK